MDEIVHLISPMLSFPEFIRLSSCSNQMKGACEDYNVLSYWSYIYKSIVFTPQYDQYSMEEKGETPNLLLLLFKNSEEEILLRGWHSAINLNTFTASISDITTVHLAYQRAIELKLSQSIVQSNTVSTSRTLLQPRVSLSACETRDFSITVSSFLSVASLLEQHFYTQSITRYLYTPLKLLVFAFSLYLKTQREGGNPDRDAINFLLIQVQGKGGSEVKLSYSSWGEHNYDGMHNIRYSFRKRDIPSSVCTPFQSTIEFLCGIPISQSEEVETFINKIYQLSGIMTMSALRDPSISIV